MSNKKILNVRYVLPPLAGHGHRGIGVYTHELLRELKNNTDIVIRETGSSTVEKPIDVVHYPYFDPFFLTLPFYHSSPFIVTVHDLIPIVFPREFPSGIRGSLKWQLQKHLLRKASLVITDSFASQAVIIEHTAISPVKIKVIYLGVDQSFYPETVLEAKEKIRKKFQLLKPFMLYVGDVNYNKNIPKLLLAFQILTEKRDMDLVLVGKGFITSSEHKDRIDRQINLLHLQSRVHIAGYVTQEELRGLYSQAVCYVHPSIVEGFGLPVLEAMACGCPVVCSQSTSLGEIASGVSVNVDPLVPQDIARGMREVVNNPFLQQELRKKGLAHVKRFTWKRAAEETVEAYKSVV